MKEERGEITVLFTLLLLVLIAFVNSMLYIVTVQTSKNLAQTDMYLAVQSVFAEYQTALLETYDIFALDINHGTDGEAEVSLKERLAYYGASGMEPRIDGIRYLTDQDGAAFYEQAIKAATGGLLPDSGSTGGTDLAAALTGGDSVLEEALKKWNEKKGAVSAYSEQESAVGDRLTDLLEENGADLGADNPFSQLKEWKDRELLGEILPDGRDLSNQGVDLAQLVSHRSLVSGSGTYATAYAEGITERLLFDRYLGEHFTCFTSDQREGALQYELEYLISGKASDVENLKASAQKLLLLRTGFNFLYLNTDETKKAQARTAALAISGGVGIPALSEPVAQGLLLLWAYEESISDVKCLFGGGKVSLIKTASEWGNAGADGKGLSYRQYLQLFLLGTSLKQTRMRALDLIEQNIRYADGGEGFRLDRCVNRIRLHTQCKLEQGAKYTFDTEFGYQ